MSLARISWFGPAVALAMAAGAFVGCSGEESAPSADAATSTSSSSGAATDGASTSSSGGDTQGVGIPCDVDRVLADRCRQCHQSPALFGAPMPLLSYEQLMAPSLNDPAKSTLDRVRERMANQTMPPGNNTKVSEAELAVVDGWIAAGAPRGSERCDDGTPTEPIPGVDCVPDVSLRPASKFTMPRDKQDEYVCYGVDVTPAQARHVFAMAPSVDNTTILHHVLLFESPSTYSSTPQPCSAGGATTWRLVYGWAPGGSSIVLPPEVGMPLTGTKHYVVQLHYNNATALSDQHDGSGFDLCSTTELRENEADVLAFGTRKIDLPPGSSRRLDCKLTIPEQLGSRRFIAAMPHMHQIGTRISTTVRHQNGSEQDLGTVEQWDFRTQYWQPLSVDVVPGDQVRTQCSYHNGTGAKVEFGENTSDEMCYSFSMYYPRIDTPLFVWGLPAELADCDVIDE